MHSKLERAWLLMNVNVQHILDACERKPGVIRDFPFDDKVLTFRVMGKIFAFLDITKLDSIALKCDPAHAIALRQEYAGVLPGYHLNKKHWNTVMLDADVPESLVLELVDISYNLIAASLKKADREKLRSLSP